jgi:hypothetical protein
MGDVAYSIDQQNEPDKTVEIIVHVEETLGDERWKVPAVSSQPSSVRCVTT